ncbi:MAG: type IV secretion system protein [Rhodoferax sp.]|nr:type IV secretion system protein [Rhodoferax sp.]
MLTIYVVLWGWSMMRGVINEPMTDGASRIVRLSLIVGIALTVGRYNTFLSDMLWNSPDVLAGYIASGFSNAAPTASSWMSCCLKFTIWGTPIGKSQCRFRDAAHSRSWADCHRHFDLGRRTCSTAYGAFLLILQSGIGHHSGCWPLVHFHGYV